ncbi:MAG: NodT family RND efflux system outer membrane lipoprotein [Gammaproteobacteria bacterium]|nr:MAG: NodT family RND efflux system outer membrane lipoprotein [Gammaproteobacteria bacterium]TND06663.1 MAG: NodT family RND efflux system outer membrane lipoprotein [Gammaproteobacteria bacterium]
MSASSRFVRVRGIAGLTLLALLTGCAVGPDYKRPDLALPAAYPDAASGAASASTGQRALAADWWTLYGDTALNDLVATALLNNSDLRLALARIDEAEAVWDQVGSARFPAVDLDASSTRSRSSTLSAQPLAAGTPTISNAHRLALSTSFELDFWGKLRRNSEAARARLLGTRYARDVSALTLAGATTQSYFTLRSLDAQIAASQATLHSRDESLTVIKSRAAGGLASELEVSQAQGARADASLQLRELQRQRTLVEHQLGLLTGKLDVQIAAGDIMQLPTPATPPVGLPSTLVERRPDVQQAEQALIAANARIGVAKAAQLPTFSLTGDFGGSSKELSDVLDSGARIWSVGLAGTLPIFDAGKYAARSREAEAVQRQALASYQKSIETAFKEVADALTNVAQSAAAARDMQIKVDAARSALRLSDLRYKAGYSGYLEVLDAQRSANAAELALVQYRQTQLVYSVDLMKALGGGWSPTDTSSAREQR